mgnify:CR=1 FL=1
MAGLATKETDRSVTAFIDNIENKSKRADSRKILAILEEVTGKEPKVWGNEKVTDFLIGFGRYTYRRKGSKEDLEWFHVGFAPRKTKLTLYLSFDINAEENLLNDLGKCSWGKGCLSRNPTAPHVQTGARPICCWHAQCTAVHDFKAMNCSFRAIRSFRVSPVPSCAGRVLVSPKGPCRDSTGSSTQKGLGVRPLLLSLPQGALPTSLPRRRFQRTPPVIHHLSAFL